MLEFKAKYFDAFITPFIFLNLQALAEKLCEQMSD